MSNKQYIKWNVMDETVATCRGNSREEIHCSASYLWLRRVLKIMKMCYELRNRLEYETGVLEYFLVVK
jgi:hypothetical protein